jgi:membrane-associated protease RseP (regulator of RpoE activity)
MNPEMEPVVTVCGNCREPMPRQLRFCRNCGYRLGEGSAEYTETVHFQKPPAAFSGNGSASSFPPYAAPGAMSAPSGAPIKKRRKRMSGMTWMFLGLLIFFVVAAGLTAIIRPIRRNIGDEIARQQAAPRSYVGVNSFDTTEEGVTFRNVEPPGSPADKAGLVGGDIVTTFDGQAITTDDQMTDLLSTTPVGKTVDVVYIRDGETKTTKLTTVGKEEFDRLGRIFGRRPEGHGRFGFDDDNTERVPIPGTKMFGIRLDEVHTNFPADMAGIKEGDIIIEFDKVPIRTSGELSSRVRRAVPYSTVTVVVMRGAERIEIPVKMGRE